MIMGTAVTPSERLILRGSGLCRKAITHQQYPLNLSREALLDTLSLTWTGIAAEWGRSCPKVNHSPSSSGYFIRPPGNRGCLFAPRGLTMHLDKSPVTFTSPVCALRLMKDTVTAYYTETEKASLTVRATMISHGFRNRMSHIMSLLTVNIN